MRLVLICTDVVGTRMAGPGIRYWELAHALAGRHEVTLVAPDIDLESRDVRLISADVVDYRKLLQDTDIVFTQFLAPPLLLALQRSDTRLVIDAYVPMIFEALHTNLHLSSRVRDHKAATLRGVQALSLLAADAVVCASERQRALWTGALMALGRVTPKVYDQDPSLRSLVEVVPFGLPVAPPARVDTGPRERFGLHDDDVVALWGGGIWNWFDPLTVIRGLALAREKEPRLRLVFMGTQHPGSDDPQTETGRRTEELIDALGQRDKGVFVNYGWLPYAYRQDWLLDADLGVSATLDIAESPYAFRTRVLDYLWAGLPSLITEGDPLAELAAREGFGRALPVGDADAWAESFELLAENVDTRRAWSAAALRIADQYRWPRIAEQLEKVLMDVEARAPRRLTLRQAAAGSEYLGRGAASVLSEMGLSGTWKRLWGRQN